MASFNWIPWVGDPTVAGWTTVVLYLLTSLSCWKSGREAGLEHGRGSNERCAWRSIAILFLALGVSKQFNLMTALTVIGRDVARFQGWYDRRQPMQIVLMGLLAMSCVLVVTTLLIWMRRAPVPTWLALIGATLTLTFVLARAISYHDVDRFLAERILGLHWNWVIEIGGTSLVLFAGQWRQLSLSKSTSGSRTHR